MAARSEYHVSWDAFCHHRISHRNYAVEARRLPLDHHATARRSASVAGGEHPDVDFSELRPGTTLALPKVEAINRQ